jgi:phage tail-like protein
MTMIAIPSVQISSAYMDELGATQGASTSSNVETYALSNGLTLTVAVDGGGVQTVTFASANFLNIAEATAEEVANSITAQITGALASAGSVTKDVTITSATYGTSSSIQVTGGTANSVIGFDTAVHSGSNATDQILTNRIPEPNETGVPIASNISVDIFDASGTAPPTSSIDIYVDTVHAYDGDGTGFQSGFTGSGSAVSNPATGVRRVVIDPNSDFQASATVTVRVVVGGTLDETYTFITYDTVAPIVSSIVATGVKTVRITFNEAMLQASAAGSADTLNPANYTIERNPPENTPATEVSVTSVTAVSTSVVDLTANIELTFGLEYLLTVENVTDVMGNIVSPAGSVDEPFNAFLPDFPEGRSFLLWDMMPELNRNEDRTHDLKKFLACIQEPTNVLLYEIDNWLDILDPDFAPIAFVEAMLQDLGNPFTFVDLDDIDKRKLAQLLIPIYKQKGTGKGIINVVRLLLGLDITITAFNTMSVWILGDNATQARIQSANSETFALSNGQTLIVRIDDTTDITATFNTGDFIAIGAATAVEVAAVIHADITGVSAGAVADGTVLLQHDTPGSGTSIQIVGGTANAVLGFPTTISKGTGTHSTDVSQIEVSSILAPGTSRERFTFEIHSAVTLTTEQRERIEIIANYMKPERTHLLRIVGPTTDVPPDHLELGVSYLGGTITDPGTWILH